MNRRFIDFRVQPNFTSCKNFNIATFYVESLSIFMQDKDGTFMTSPLRK